MGLKAFRVWGQHKQQTNTQLRFHAQSINLGSEELGIENSYMVESILLLQAVAQDKHRLQFRAMHKGFKVYAYSDSNDLLGMRLRP